MGFKVFDPELNMKWADRHILSDDEELGQKPTRRVQIRSVKLSGYKAKCDGVLTSVHYRNTRGKQNAKNVRFYSKFLKKMRPLIKSILHFDMGNNVRYDDFSEKK